ncbi:MAG: TIR domain-containing protein [Pleurocapsa minor GSE-CHR-MK-17-07R]|jgi:hypothetical protein|nr:TIR domain-containing protein [Pleurocapsa minor GSE-CHR-MK 17-07R]
MKLFLIHGPTDQQVASNVRRELKTAGYSVRTHADIAYSAGEDEFMESLNTTIYDSDYVIVILSEQALKAKIVTGVLDFAAHIGKPIFALFSGDLSRFGLMLPPELEFLDELEWLDAADSAIWLAALLDETAADPFADDDDEESAKPDKKSARPGLIDEDRRRESSASKPDAGLLDGSTSNGASSGVMPTPSPQPSQSATTSRPPAPIMPLPAPEPTTDFLEDNLSKEELEAEAQADEAPAASGGESEDAGLAFASYAPKEAAIDMWIPLAAYVYREGFESAVQADASDLLKSALDDYRRNQSDALMPVAEGALIIATPTLEGFQINPPAVSIALYESWHRFDFKVRAKTAPPDLAVNGKITFSVEGVIVADIPISIFVTSKPSPGRADGTQVQGAAVRPYPAIFCSYSHKDTAIVERVERAYRILGSQYLRDATTLRSGEDWNDALMDMIDRADIFQLFWSPAAAASKYVQQEWEYALSVRDRKAAFIRPVYWQMPMPPPPDPLADIHFVFEPGLDD